MSGALFFKDETTSLLIRASGHITANICADLRPLVFDALDREDPPRQVAVWLEDTRYMDSTFMGLLAGINKRLLKMGADRLILVRPSQSAVELLQELGVLALVDRDEGDRVFPEGAEELGKSVQASADLLLKAHENLMELSDDNRERFKTLHTVLKAQKDSLPEDKEE